MSKQLITLITLIVSLTPLISYCAKAQMTQATQTKTYTITEAGQITDPSIPQMKLESEAFVNGDPIPDEYSGYGLNQSPPLHWSDVPAGTQSFVIICKDPDAPKKPFFFQWGIFDIPNGQSNLSKGQLKGAMPTGGMKQCKNNANKTGYYGPKPPVDNKVHHYYFEIYALSIVLQKTLGGIEYQKLFNAMSGHILAKGSLMGTYQKATE